MAKKVAIIPQEDAEKQPSLYRIACRKLAQEGLVMQFSDNDLTSNPQAYANLLLFMASCQLATQVKNDYSILMDRARQQGQQSLDAMLREFGKDVAETFDTAIGYYEKMYTALEEQQTPIVVSKPA